MEISAIFDCMDLPLVYVIKDGTVSGPATYRTKVRDEKGEVTGHKVNSASHIIERLEAA